MLNYQEGVKKSRPWLKYKSLKKSQKISLGLLSSNLLILLVIGIFIFIIPQSSTIKTDSNLSISGNSSSVISNPLDQLASANIALAVSEVTNLPEQTPIRDTSESQQAELNQASTEDNVISEPQVLQTALKSRADIFSYVVKAGDTVSSLAVKFGITSNSILWSNGLTGNNLTAGQSLVIPPVSGIVYTVKSGDTASSLAQKYNASEAEIVAYNDAEISSIYTGEQILIPSGTIQVAPVAPVWIGAQYGYNGYDYGYCTWYVAEEVKAVPANWGNASSWAYYAQLSGWNVSSTPTVGAIAQTPYAAGGEGHVAIVTAVNGDTIEYKDMNGIAGWGRVGDSSWVSASLFPNYITP